MSEYVWMAVLLVVFGVATFREHVLLATLRSWVAQTVSDYQKSLGEASDHNRQLQRDFERRLKEERAAARQEGLIAGGADVVTHVYTRSYKKVRLLFRYSVDAFLVVTLYRDQVKYLYGDIKNVDLFTIPPAILKAIQRAAIPIGASICIAPP